MRRMLRKTRRLLRSRMASFFASLIVLGATGGNLPGCQPGTPNPPVTPPTPTPTCAKYTDVNGDYYVCE